MDILDAVTLVIWVCAVFMSVALVGGMVLFVDWFIGYARSGDDINDLLDTAWHCKQCGRWFDGMDGPERPIFHNNYYHRFPVGPEDDDEWNQR